jgi:hypothetical protein
MSDLGTALRELAERQPSVAADDAGVLWARGRRRIRRRRAIGAAVAAVVLAAVGLGTVLVPDPVVVMPAGPVHAPGYPDQVYRPSRWLASTDDKGPLGQLAVIAPAQHGGDIAMFGVSATTGEYRFLDLPDWVRGSKVALAPDGRHVAYWMTGHTTGKPYPDPMLAGFGQAGVIAGVALYDTTNGHVQRTKLTTVHGMQDEPLVWVDSTTVYFGDWQLDNSHAASRSRWLSVAVGRSEPAEILDSQAAVMEGHRNADGSFLVPDVNARRWTSVQPAGPTGAAPGGSPGTIRLPATLPIGVAAYYTYASRAGANRVVVGVNDTPSLVNPLMVGDVAADGTVHGLEYVGDRLQNVVVLGWHDDRTLLAYGTTRKQDTILAAVDVEHGTATTLSRFTEAGWGDQLVPALDVLRGDVVTGMKPPNPPDPRWRTSGFVVGGLLLAGAATWIVRRRRRA